MRQSEATELDRLLASIRACTTCRDQPQGCALPHEPRPVLRVATTARIAICGQAPGIRVHESGVPFTDRSGDRLRDWMDVTADDFYDQRRVAIIPMGFCFPGYNPQGADLPPRRECAPAWRAQVMTLLPHLKLLLPVGLHAIKWHLPDHGRRSLTQTVADWQSILTAARAGPAVLPLPHPSWRNTGWLKSNPWFGRELLPVLRVLVRDTLETEA